MTLNGIHFPEEAITDFCRRHGVKKLSVFGSVLRPNSSEEGYGFRPSSDLDILVKFLPGRIPGLLYFGGMLMELQDMLGRNVDLKTPQDLSQDFRDEVIREAQPLYAA